MATSKAYEHSVGWTGQGCGWVQGGSGDEKSPFLPIKTI